MSYFIATWHQQLPTKAARKRAEDAIRSIDPTVTLVYHSEPGNAVRMWLERPNDGTNDYDYQRESNLQCIVAVARELPKDRPRETSTDLSGMRVCEVRNGWTREQ